MKLGIVAGRSERGGFSAVLDEIHEALERGLEVQLLAPPAERISALPRQVTFSALVPPSRHLLKAVLSIRRWEAKFRPDVVHVHGRAGGAAARIALVGSDVKIAYTPHGGFPPSGWQRGLEWVLQRVLRLRTSLYVMVGNAEAEAWRREYGFGGRPLVIMPNAVDPDRVARLAGTHERSRGGVLVPGAYHPRKRFGDVLGALALVDEPRPHVEFLGNTSWDGGRYIRDLQRRVGDLALDGCVTINGEVQDLPRRLAEAALVIFPSEIEGLPITALEAQALGAPVAWSDIPPHAEVFGPHGRAFALGDVDEIASILKDPGSWRDLGASIGRARDIHGAAVQLRAAALDALVGLGRSS